MATKNGWKTIFWKRCHYALQIRCGSKISSKSLYLSLFLINAFLRFTQKFKMAAQKWQEKHFWEKSPVHFEDTLCVKNFVQIALSRTFSDINAYLHFTKKFKIVAQIGAKRFLGKIASRLHRYPVGQKFH